LLLLAEGEMLTGNHAMPVGALLAALIVGLKNHRLLAGVAALEQYDNLAILENCEPHTN
jgi:hypothetical protein